MKRTIAAIEAIAAARSAAGIADPVVVDGHPDRPDQRGIQSPGGTFVMLPQETTLAALTTALPTWAAPSRYSPSTPPRR